MLEAYLKSVIEMDRSTIIICDLNHIVIYMNAAAKKRYEGQELMGKSILNCHNSHSNEMIQKVVDWFQEDESHNMIHTFYNPKQNKDLYMVALRDENNKLIGYYEKHEFRNVEKASLYDFSQSLV